MRWFLLVAWLSSTIPAWADANSASARDKDAPERRRAAELFDRAASAYEHRQWQDAARDFEQANQIVPNEVAAEYAIRAHTQASRLDRAATLAETTKSLYPSRSALRVLCDDVLDEAAPVTARVTLSCRVPCELTLDGESIEAHASKDASVYVNPGSHQLVVSFRGGALERRTLEASKGQPLHVSLEPSRAPEPRKAPQRHGLEATGASAPSPKPAQVATEGWSPIAFWTGIGLTSTSAILTTVSAVYTANHPGPDRIRTECAKDDVDCPLYREGLANQRRTNYLLATTAVLGIATLATGAWLTDWKGHERPVPPRSQRAGHGTARAIPVDFGIGTATGIGCEVHVQGVF